MTASGSAAESTAVLGVSAMGSQAVALAGTRSE